MKISTYHKMLGDEVRFVKGIDKEIDEEVWDRIYVTTLFTFDFDLDVETIKHYKNLDEFHALLAMPRELIMFRSHFEGNGITAEWQTLYRKLTEEQKQRLMKLVSLNVADLKKIPWPDDLKEILEFYLIKWSGKTEQMEEKYIQMSLMDDSDIVIDY